MVVLTRVEKNWSQKGFSCDIWTDPPGRVWADFVHPVDEMVMLLKGELELQLNGRIYRPKIGEEILVPAGTTHTVKNIGKKTNQWFYGYHGK